MKKLSITGCPKMRTGKILIRLRSLIVIFAGRTCPHVVFLTLLLISFQNFISICLKGLRSVERDVRGHSQTKANTIVKYREMFYGCHKALTLAVVKRIRF